MLLEERVISVIRENSEENYEISVESNLQNDLDIDSFGIIMITNGIEDEFNITIEDSHLEQITSVREIASLLRSEYGVKE